MKSTLTSADPSGWYECDDVKRGRVVVRYWNGGLIATSPGQFCKLDYTNFRRLFTEADVAALNEELRTLREELDKQKENVRFLNRDYNIRNTECNEYRRKLKEIEGQLKLKEIEGQLDTARDYAVTLTDKNLAMEKVLSRRQEAATQPYQMRKADKPDCVGLWKMKDCDPFEEYHIHGEYPEGPYYYLGPIPVIPKEQLPPKVVKVRYMDNEYDAVPLKSHGFLLLGHDGSGERYVTKEEVEAAQ